MCGLLLAAGVLARAVSGAEADVRASAEHILRSAELRGGVIAHLGCGDGRLTAELGRSRRFIVHGLSADGREVNRAREYIRSQRLYGRVSVERGSFERLPYAASLVNLVVAEDGPALLAKNLALEEVFRVLVPRGVVCLGAKGGGAAEEELKERMKKAGLQGCEVVPEKTRRWIRWRKPTPTDLWAGPPQSLQWLVSEYHLTQNTVHETGSACGRIFHRVALPWSNENGKMVVSWRAHWRPSLTRGTVGPYKVDFPIAVGPSKGRAAAVFVIARDAHNGRILWIRALEHRKSGKKGRRGSLLEVAGERVYTVAEDKLVALDARTGELVRAYEGLPAAAPRVHQGTLLFEVGDEPSLIAADAETGKVLWRASVSSVRLGDGAVFGRKGTKNGPLVCLDVKTGREQWSKAGVEGTLCALGEGVLILRSSGGLGAVSSNDGSPLWNEKLWWGSGSMVNWCKVSNRKFMDGVPQPLGKPYYDGGQVYLLEGLVWVCKFEERANARPLRVYDEKRSIRVGQPHFHEYDPWYAKADPRIIRTMSWVGMDPLTGAVRTQLDYPKDIPLRAFACCGPPKVTERFIHGEPRGVMDLRIGKWYPVPAARATCKIGFHFGEGLTFAPPCGCRCYPNIKDRGYMAVAPLEWETARGQEDQDAGRFERGPAFGKVPSGGGGVEFSIEEDQHLLEARDARSKGVRWRFVAAGRIDTPPVVCQGMALVGARDGYVYALRISDGALVWRFRAAPRERRVVAYDQLESASPVVGGVLVADGTAYFLAGLHSEFPGGVTVYAVKPRDGTIVWKRRFDAKGGTSTRGGPAWGDVVVAAKPIRDGTRLIIPGKLGLPPPPVRPIDGLGGKILDLKSGEPQKPVGARFYKNLYRKETFIFDAKELMWKELKVEN